jgi:pimeloyl-ACP methyl ester carboxylesterase
LIALLALAICASNLQAEEGFSESPLFILDVRYKFGAAEGRIFPLDTRSAGQVGFTASSVFTLNTMSAAVGSVTVFGRVTSASGSGLAGVVVSAVVNGRAAALALTDLAGDYRLPLLPPGTYDVRASRADYLTGIRGPLALSADSSVRVDFRLTPRPGPVVTMPVNRDPEPSLSPGAGPTEQQLKVWASDRWSEGPDPDRNKLTIVLTHGWNSSPNNWPFDMANALVTALGNAVNIVTWDWEDAAKSLNPNQPFSRTPAQGRALGQALHRKLGNSYSPPLHFIGHSYGTLVNAQAANYLHDTANPPYAWQRTHMTLLDNAEVGNLLEPVLQALRTAGLPPASALSGLASLVNSLNQWVPAVPDKAAWMDNYISLVGLFQDRAVNACLLQSTFFAGLPSPTAWHGYAYEWYRKTVINPTAAPLGHRYSFEKLGSSVNLAASVPYEAGSYFAQSTLLDELALSRLEADPDIVPCQLLLTATAPLLVELAVANEAGSQISGAVQYVGQVTTTVVEKSADLVGDIFHTLASYTGSAASELAELLAKPGLGWSLRVALTTSAPLPTGPARLAAGSGPTNTPAYSWFTVAIPSNAVAMTFDFQLSGDGSNDCLVFGIDGTNQFTLETRFIPQDVPLNSGLLNVKPWSGRSVELFFGVLGGSSTNATVTVDGLRFFAAVPPRLEFARSPEGLSLSWPISASDFTLETRNEVSGNGPWTPTSQATNVVNFRYTLSQPVTGPRAFYRLSGRPLNNVHSVSGANMHAVGDPAFWRNWVWWLPP